MRWQEKLPHSLEIIKFFSRSHFFRKINFGHYFENLLSLQLFDTNFVKATVLLKKRLQRVDCTKCFFVKTIYRKLKLFSRNFWCKIYRVAYLKSRRSRSIFLFSSLTYDGVVKLYQFLHCRVVRTRTTSVTSMLERTFAATSKWLPKTRIVLAHFFARTRSNRGCEFAFSHLVANRSNHWKYQRERLWENCPRKSST